jgi:RimJ/RimL family protein N-acetyltransferase
MDKVIRTDRLVLRPLVDADAPGIARLIGTLDVSRWLTVVPHPYSEQDARDFIRDFASDWRFGIEIAGEIAGVIEIANSLGYWLGQPHWGHGYMSEAAQGIVTAWFSANDTPIKSGYFTDNARSGAVLRKLGFRPGAVIAEHSLAQGRDVALQQMQLSRADWLARHG